MRTTCMVTMEQETSSAETLCVDILDNEVLKTEAPVA